SRTVAHAGDLLTTPTECAPIRIIWWQHSRSHESLTSRTCFALETLNSPPPNKSINTDHGSMFVSSRLAEVWRFECICTCCIASTGLTLSRYKRTYRHAIVFAIPFAWNHLGETIDHQQENERSEERR